MVWLHAPEQSCRMTHLTVEMNAIVSVRSASASSRVAGIDSKQGLRQNIQKQVPLPVGPSSWLCMKHLTPRPCYCCHTSSH